MDATEATPIPAPGVERKIGLAWLALAWEGMWPRLMPLLAVVALFVAAAHLDLFGGLDPWVHTGVLAALAAGFVGLGWWRFRGYVWPVRAEAIRRLEQDSGVPHRPLVAVQDSLAAGSSDPMAAALWEAHRRREAARLAGLSNKAAHPGLARFDTWALRLVPVLALIVAVASAGGWRTDRMMAAVTPAFPPPPPVVANLWIAPPAYTGKPPIYLDMADHEKVLRVPVGSKLAGFVDDVRGRHAPKLVIDGKETEFNTVSKGKYQVESVITEGSKIALQARGDEQAAWKLHVIPDLAADHRVRPPDRRRQMVDQDRVHRRRRFRHHRRAAADPPARLGAGRRHAGRGRGARGAAGRPAGRRQQQEGGRHLRARPHRPSVGGTEGPRHAVRHRRAGPEGQQHAGDLPAARARVQRPDGARPDHPAQAADARSQGAAARRRRRHAADPDASQVVPRRSGGPARPARRRGAAGGERRQAGDRRQPEAAVGPRDAARAGRHLRRRARRRAGPPGAARRHAAPGRRRGDREADPAALPGDGPLAEGDGRADEGSGGTPPHGGAGGEDGSEQHHHRRRPAEDARQDSRDGQERRPRGRQADARRAAQDDGERHPDDGPAGPARAAAAAGPARPGQPAGPRDDEPARPAVAAPEPAAGRERARGPPAAGPARPAGQQGQQGQQGQRGQQGRVSRARASSPARAIRSGARTRATSRAACAASSATS